MKKFEFRKRDFTMEFPNDVIRTVEYNDELIKKTQEMSDALKEITKGEEINQEEMIDLLLDYVDDILGEGTSDEIFKGKEIHLLDVIDLVNFIMKSTEESQNEILESYKAQAETPTEIQINRAQRRAAKRAEGK